MKYTHFTFADDHYTRKGRTLCGTVVETRRLYTPRANNRSHVSCTACLLVHQWWVGAWSLKPLTLRRWRAAPNRPSVAPPTEQEIRSTLLPHVWDVGGVKVELPPTASNEEVALAVNAELVRRDEEERAAAKLEYEERLAGARATEKRYLSKIKRYTTLLKKTQRRIRAFEKKGPPT